LHAELVLFGNRVLGSVRLVNGVAVPDASIANLLVDLPVWGPDGKGRSANLKPEDGEPYIRALKPHFSGYLSLRVVEQEKSRAPARRSRREQPGGGRLEGGDRPLAGAQAEPLDR
jgi:hypothetical protein